MIRHYLDASTAHIRPEECARLADDHTPVSSVRYHQGYWLHVPAPSILADPEIDWSGWESLMALLRFAHRQGCTWIRLDPAGAEIPSLPTHRATWKAVECRPRRTSLVASASQPAARAGR